MAKAPSLGVAKRHVDGRGEGDLEIDGAHFGVAREHHVAGLHQQRFSVLIAHSLVAAKVPEPLPSFHRVTAPRCGPGASWCTTDRFPELDAVHIVIGKPQPV